MKNIDRENVEKTCNIYLKFPQQICLSTADSGVYLSFNSWWRLWLILEIFNNLIIYELLKQTILMVNVVHAIILVNGIDINSIHRNDGQSVM